MDEPTLEDRAASALAALAATMPAKQEVLDGRAALPEWMAAKWLAALTDPADPKFSKAVTEAEAWLSAH